MPPRILYGMLLTILRVRYADGCATSPRAHFPASVASLGTCTIASASFGYTIWTQPWASRRTAYTAPTERDAHNIEKLFDNITAHPNRAPQPDRERCSGGARGVARHDKQRPGVVSRGSWSMENTAMRTVYLTTSRHTSQAYTNS